MFQQSYTVEAWMPLLVISALMLMVLWVQRLRSALAQERACVINRAIAFEFQNHLRDVAHQLFNRKDDGRFEGRPDLMALCSMTNDVAYLFHHGDVDSMRCGQLLPWRAAGSARKGPDADSWYAERVESIRKADAGAYEELRSLLLRSLEDLEYTGTAVETGLQLLLSVVIHLVMQEGERGAPV